MPAHSYMEESLTAMLAAKRLAGVAPEVNLGEHVTYMPLSSVNKVAHSGFETQNSKTGVSVAPQKGLMSSKNFKKKKMSRTPLNLKDLFHLQRPFWKKLAGCQQVCCLLI